MQRYLEITSGGQNIATCLHVPSAEGARPIVVACHGLTGTRVGSSYRMVALGRQLEEMGIACLRFDFRGCGESDGRFQDVTSATLLNDLHTVMDAVTKLPNVDVSRVGIVGSSFGAYTASRAVERMAGLKACVFFAPVADPGRLTQQDMTPEAWAFLRKNGCIDHHGLPLAEGFFDTLPTDDVPQLLARRKPATLIFHGSGDKQVPIDQGRMYETALKKAGATVELHPLDTSDHGMRGVKYTESVVAGSAAWLKKYL